MQLIKKTYENIGEVTFFGVHGSGLKVYIIPKPGFGKAYAIFGTKFGSVTNRFSLRGEDVVIPDGVAHFLEHKLFEEPEGNIFSEFAAQGAAANAFTSFDITAYLFSVTGGVYNSLKTLLEFVQNPYFTDENVAKEQGIIGQEITMYNDDAGWRVFFNMLGAMYPEHPIRIDIAGSIESISEIDKEILYKCHEAFYHPSNMALCIVGDVVPEKAAEVIENSIKKSSPPSFMSELPHDDGGILKSYTEQKMSVARPIFSMGFKEKAGTGVYKTAQYDVLLEMIFGKSSPLYNYLYDSSLINPSFSADAALGDSYGFVEMNSESDDPEKVRDIILEHLRELRKTGLDKEDFEVVKKALYGRFLSAQNNIEQTGGAVIRAAFAADDYFSYAEALMDMPFSDVWDLFGKALSEDRCVLSVVRPLGG